MTENCLGHSEKVSPRWSFCDFRELKRDRDFVWLFEWRKNHQELNKRQNNSIRTNVFDRFVTCEA